MSPRVRKLLPRLARALLVVAALAFSAYWFLLPVSDDLLAGRTDRYLGDGGGDPQTLPFQNNVILQTLRYRPHLLLFGAVYTPQQQAPLGMPMFITWIERIVVAITGLIYKDAARHIALEAWILLVTNGVACYAFARGLKWSRLLAFALAFAWAFNPYARARLDAHISLAAPFNWPLVFLGMQLVHDSVKERTSRGRVIASGLFLASFLTPHYYWFSMGFLSPFLLVYFILSRPQGVSRFRGVGSLVLCTIPSVAFVAWNVLVPFPPGLMPPGTGGIPREERSRIVYALAARPFDFVAGDIRFSLEDWLPFRTKVNEWVALPDRLNSCEPVNGIRWVLLAIAFLAILRIIVPYMRRKLTPLERRVFLGATIFLVGSFLLSMAPDFITIGGHELGLSGFAYRILGIFRCPCRNGPAVHFGVILLTGWSVHRFVNTGRRTSIVPIQQGLLAVFFVLVVIDFLPKKQLIVTPLRTARKELEAGRPGQCGTGIYAPGAGAWEENNRSQDFYGTSCNIVPMPPALRLDPAAVTRTLSCSKMSWFVYAGEPTLLRTVCKNLNWEMVSHDACRAPSYTPAVKDLKSCL
jgi:hypothetical protein